MIDTCLFIEEEVARSLIDTCLVNFQPPSSSLKDLTAFLTVEAAKPTSPIGIAARLALSSPKSIPYAPAEEQFERLGAYLAEKLFAQALHLSEGPCIDFWRSVQLAIDLSLERATEVVIASEINEILTTTNHLLPPSIEEVALAREDNE